MKTLSRKLVVGLLVAAVLLAAGVAWAADGDTIIACVNSSDGTVRLVTDPSTCKRNETAKSWYSVAGVDALVSALTGRVTALETGATTLSGRVDSLASGATTLGARVSALEASQSKTVFASSERYDGNLGGLAGADAKCQALADAAEVYNPRLIGTFKAWLSDSTAGPATRFTHSPFPYVLVNGTQVADNWADLTDGSLDSPINVTEQGDTVPTGYPARVWTGTGTNGTASSSNCGNWTLRLTVGLPAAPRPSP